MSHLMEKVKLSSYVKKGVKNNFDSSGANFYDSDQIVSNESKTK